MMLTLASGFELNQTLVERLGRFFADLSERAATGWPAWNTTQLVVTAAVLLGITCGVLGCFMILRRQSLLGDAIGHAVLPGVCVGFIFAGTKNTGAILLGALIAGVLASMLIALLERTTRLKSGECMGVVFTGFYGVGIVLLKHIQNQESSGQSGLDRFLFGQIVGISHADVVYMAVIALLSVTLVMTLWKKLAVVTFDPGFAIAIGLPVKSLQYLLTGLLTVAIVISIQAVGVVLVSAMLVTPAATAYLLTDRLHRMVILAAIFGAVAGVMGAFFSLFGAKLPTGAFMVLAASLLFAGAFLLSPRHGLIPRIGRVWERRRRTGAENLLRTMYLIMERRHGDDLRFGVHDIAAKRQETPAHVRRLWRIAANQNWVDPKSPDPIILTPAGMAEAQRVVRNHRLWELFLTQEAKLGADQVHTDAEYIEHVLPPEVLARLELMLEHPQNDPHGKPIPVVGHDAHVAHPAGGAV